MKTLILVRHGKSSWETPATDKERPLLERGFSDIKKIANFIKNNLPFQFAIYSSDAVRGAATCKLFSEVIEFPLENIIFRSDLYTFDVESLKNSVNSFDDDIDNLILFGHNNALTDFANQYGNKFIENISTSGLVWIEFQTNSWQLLKRGQTKKIIFPKTLL